MTSRLLGVVGADTPVGYPAGGGGRMIIDHQLDKGYFIEIGTVTGTNGMKKFSLGQVGTEDLQATETDMFGAGPAHLLTTLSGCYNQEIGELFVSIDTGNSRPIARLDSETLVATEIFGNSSASTAPSTNGPPALILASDQMIAGWSLDNQFIASAAINPFLEVCIIDVTSSPMNILFAQNCPEGPSQLCPGANGANATFFGIAGATSPPNANPIGLYKYTLGLSPTRTRLRGILPGDVDPLWTHFAGASAPGYDLADGGVMIFFLTSDAVPNTAYLTKFDGNTGDPKWSLPVLSASTIDLTQCNVQGQLMGWKTVSNNMVAIIDTIEATVVELPYNVGLSTMFQQVFDASTQSITGVLSGGYTEFGTPIPNYLGPYLAAHGNAIPVNRSGRIWPGGEAKSYVEIF